MSETATQVRERPILFSGPMVRALLDGRKTQTRRVVTSPGSKYPGYNALADECLRCPYGAPGDRLWVREGWHPQGTGSAPKWTSRWVAYREHNEGLGPFDGVSAHQLPALVSWEGVQYAHWHSARYMPRWASRLTLELTDVRVQRVQEISEDDARAEGISVLPLQSADDPSAWWQSAPGQHQARTPREAFAALWDSINGARGYGWDANPWVWCVTFRRVEVPDDA